MASPSDFVDWAVSCLEVGLDSKNIGILASLGRPSSMFEVENYLRGSFNDLGWRWPDFRTSILWYAADIAEEILNGAIDPFLGCYRISDITQILDDPVELAGWAELDSEVAELSGELEDEWKNDGVNESNLSKRILAKARALLKEIEKTF
jgi:hypothetical protein